MRACVGIVDDGAIAVAGIDVVVVLIFIADVVTLLMCASRPVTLCALVVCNCRRYADVTAFGSSASTSISTSFSSSSFSPSQNSASTCTRAWQTQFAGGKGGSLRVC